MSLTLPPFITNLVIRIVGNLVVKEINKKSSNDKNESSKAETVSYRENENHKSVIIFLHGFTGDPRETFVNIPDLLRANESVDGYDIFSVGYSSKFMPDIGANIWSADPDIDNLSKYFKTLINTRFNNYDRICIVTHSMGGLVAQRGILMLDKKELKRITHFLMFGTPSNGLEIANLRIAKKIKRQIRDLGSNSTFITELRKDWNERFQSEYPFIFGTVAGLSDEFISRNSSLEVFKDRYQYQIEGNHSNMVKANNSEDFQNQCFRLILFHISPNNLKERFQDVNNLQLNQFIANNKKIIDVLDDDIPSLDANGLKKLVLAYDCLSQDDNAIIAIKMNKLSEVNSDFMGILGGRYKRKYLFNGNKQRDAIAAIEYYKKGYSLAVKNNDREQLYYHAINIAFISLVSEGNKEKMKIYAEIALRNCNSSSESYWELATIAEANLYLRNQEKAKDYYQRVYEKTKDKIRVRSSIYLNAKFAYEALSGVEN